MANFTGTAAGDRLVGTIFADTIDGAGGNDTIQGGPGADQLNGGDGDDVIVERDGGADTLDGGAGDDILTVDRTGKVGLTTPSGTPLDPVHINGGTGNDTISFVGGQFFIDAGDGDDLVRVLGFSRAGITLGLGRDTLRIDDFYMHGPFTSPQLGVSDFKTGTAASGGDRLDIQTLLGSKLINWDQVSNPFTSGYVRLVGDSFGVTVNIYPSGFGTDYVNLVYLGGARLGALTDYDLGGFTTSSTPPPATNVTGTGADETFYGTAGADTIDGGAGNDHIEGGFGGDTLRGGDGDDYLNGQTGTDTLYGGIGNDRLEDTAGGSDVLNGEDGDDVIAASRSFNMPAGTLTLNGGAGRDDISYKWIFDGSETSFPTKVFTTVIDAGDGDDVVHIGGVRGTVQLTLGAGADMMVLGSDFVAGKGTIAIADFAAGADGDRIDLSAFLAANATNWNGSDNPFASGHLALVQVSATQLALEYDANGGADSLVPIVTFGALDAAAFAAANFAGWDPNGAAAVPGSSFSGTDAGDTFTGGTGADAIDGQGGGDVLAGGAGNDILTGGDGNDSLSGGAGADQLDGGAGDDILEDSGGGADIIVGGAGNDHIVITRAANALAGVTAQASGGDDDDSFTINVANVSTVALDGGAGNDTFDFQLLKGGATLTLGAGQDTIRLERDYFGPYTNQTRVQPIVVTDFETGPNGDRIDLHEAMNFALFSPSDANFRQGNLRLVQDGSDVLLQYTYAPTSTTAPFQTLFRFQNHLVADFTNDNFIGEQLPHTLVVADDASVVTNADYVFGMPAARITGNGATLVNAAGARLEAGFATQPGEISAAVVFAGTGETLINQKGAVIANLQTVTGLYGTTDTAILGSDHDDIVRNNGQILGAVKLGAGNDSFIETLAPENDFYSYASFDFGDGDDVMDLDASGVTYFDYAQIAGGNGHDTLIFRNIGPTMKSEWQGTGFEELRLLPAAPGAIFTMSFKPAFETVHLAAGLTFQIPDRKTGTPYTLTPFGTLYLDGGNFSTGLQASFATIVGSDAAETVILTGSKAAAPGSALGLTSVSLAGGDDRFEWNYNQPKPGSVDGGAGQDWLLVSQTTTALDLTGFTGFETVELAFASFPATPFVETVKGVAADAQRLLLGLVPAGTIQLDLSDPALAVGVSNAKLVILAGSTIGSVADRALLDAGFAAQSQTVENRGHIAGGIDLGAGDDAVVNSGDILGDVLLGPGNDTFTDTAGSTVGGAIRGGLGDDVYYINNAADVVVENAGEGTDEIRTTLANFVLPASVEKLTYVGTGNFSATGSTGDDNVAGNTGNDFFDLSQGGADKAAGGAGNDAFSFGASFGAGDSVDGGTGTDTVGILGNYTGANQLTIAAGQLVNVETLSIQTGNAGSGPVGYDILWQDGNLASGQQITIYAGNLRAGENLSFDGSAETHGHFVFYGGLGTDNLKGGSGSDGFYFGPGKFTQADHVDGGAGSQNQLGLDGSYDFEAGSALGTFGGNFANIQTVVLYAGKPGDPSAPYPNTYHIVTNEAAVAAGAMLTIYGVPVVSDLVFDGSAEHDGGAFRILSGTGNDTLTGGAGNDILYGNMGADTLTGGAGNDTFLYTAAAQSAGTSVDHITDFDAGDHIDLSQIDADTTLGGDQAFTFIGANAFDHTAGELRAAFDAVNNVWTIEGDTDGDGNADFSLMVTTANNHAIVQGDFIA